MIWWKRQQIAKWLAPQSRWICRFTFLLPGGDRAIQYGAFAVMARDYREAYGKAVERVPQCGKGLPSDIEVVLQVERDGFA